jgi:hypothetical protein
MFACSEVLVILKTNKQTHNYLFIIVAALCLLIKDKLFIKTFQMPKKKEAIIL